jgi:RNA polymerase sigma factor (sigma-70 family)
VNTARSFEAIVLPWLDAGYNLARWLLRDEAAADDVLQEASLRALRYFDSLRGNEARPWFLGIVRNACFTYLNERSGRHEQTGFEDDELESLHYAAGFAAPDPAEVLARGRERSLVDAAIRSLPPPLREVIVLRELEGLEYAEIALVASVPIGTVMSRLSRARSRLKTVLTQAGVND